MNAGEVSAPTTLKNELPEKIVKVCEECAAQIVLIVQLSEGRVIDEAKIADLIYAFMRDLFHEISGGESQPIAASEVSAPTTPTYPEFCAQSVADGFWEVYHDDDCGETFDWFGGGICPKCKFRPDMQSIAGRKTKKAGEVSAPAPTPTQQELVNWLRNESEKRMSQALARRPGEMRKATVAELKEAQKLAEKMMGRKLPATSVKENIAQCDMQNHIADKLEKEAKQLSAWADWVAGKK